MTGTPFPVGTGARIAVDRPKSPQRVWIQPNLKLRSEQCAYNEGHVLNSDENKEQMESIITTATLRTINLGRHMPRANTNSTALF